MEGVSAGVRDGAFIVRSGNIEYAIPGEEIREVRVRTGTSWGEGLLWGLLAGALIDGAIVGFFVHSLRSGE